MKDSRTVLKINKKFANSIKDEYKEERDYENELLNCINSTLLHNYFKFTWHGAKKLAIMAT